MGSRVVLLALVCFMCFPSALMASQPSSQVELLQEDPPPEELKAEIDHEVTL